MAGDIKRRYLAPGASGRGLNNRAVTKKIFLDLNFEAIIKLSEKPDRAVS